MVAWEREWKEEEKIEKEGRISHREKGRKERKEGTWERQTNDYYWIALLEHLSAIDNVRLNIKT